MVTTSLFDFDIHFKPYHQSLPLVEKKKYGSVLNLSSNELQHHEVDIFLHKFIQNFSSDLIRKYPYYTDIKQKIADFYDIPLGQMLICSGTNFMINLILEVIAANTNRLILQSPNYINYHSYPLVNNSTIHAISYLDKPEKNFLAEMYACIENTAPATVIIANPNGFTGQKISLTDVEQIAKKCLELQHILLIDEAYISFSANGDHLGLCKQYSNVIIVRTLSKSFGLAGMRLGLVFGSKEIIAYLRKFGIENTIGNLALYYLLFLHEHFEELQCIHSEIMDARTVLIQYVRNNFPLFDVYPSEANFVTIDAKEYADQIIACFAENNVVIKKLSDFASLENHIRITVGELQIVKQIIEIFDSFKKQVLI